MARGARGKSSFVLCLQRSVFSQGRSRTCSCMSPVLRMALREEVFTWTGPKGEGRRTPGQGHILCLLGEFMSPRQGPVYTWSL